MPETPNASLAIFREVKSFPHLFLWYPLYGWTKFSRPTNGLCQRLSETPKRCPTNFSSVREKVFDIFLWYPLYGLQNFSRLTDGQRRLWGVLSSFFWSIFIQNALVFMSKGKIIGNRKKNIPKSRINYTSIAIHRRPGYLPSILYDKLNHFFVFIPCLLFVSFLLISV